MVRVRGEKREVEGMEEIKSTSIAPLNIYLHRAVPSQIVEIDHSNGKAIGEKAFLKIATTLSFVISPVVLRAIDYTRLHRDGEKRAHQSA